MRGWLEARAYERIFPRWRPDESLRPQARAAGTRDAAMVVRWLGTAGHVVETPGARLLVDPFLSRPSLARVATAPLASDEAAIFARVRTRVDAVLCGHAHFDHLLDAPVIAAQTGALLVGSASTCAFGRAAGVPEDRLVAIPPSGGVVRVGDAEVRFVPSLHGRIAFGRVPFPGEVTRTPRLPARVHAYKMGGAFGIVVRAPGATLYHNGSADLVDAALDGIAADVLLVGLAGRKATRDYLARLTRALAPRLIVPTHHDAFFAPLERGVHLLPGIDLDGFAREAARLAPGARVVTPGYDETLAVARGDASQSVLVA